MPTDRWHRLIHIIGWQCGWPEVQRINGRLLVGFMCSTCGALSSLEECPEWMQDAD